MNRSTRRHSLAALFLTALACGGTGTGGSSCGGGCGGATEPLAADLPDSVKTYNAIQARMRPEAFNFIATKFKPILKGMFPPNGDVVIAVPENELSKSCTCIGSWGGSGGRECCTGVWGFGSCLGVRTSPVRTYMHVCPSTGPIANGNCSNITYPNYRNQGHCTATVTPKGLTIGRQYPNKLTITPTLDMFTRTAANANGGVIVAGHIPLLGDFDCTVVLSAANKKPNIPLLLQVDSKTKAMFFEPDNFNLDGLIVGNDFEFRDCSAGNAAQAIQDFFASIGFDFYGWIINSVILPIAKGQIDSTIAAQVRAQTGMPCTFYKNGCGGAYPGATCATSGDNAGFCVHGGQILHKPQGMVGTTDIGAALSAMGVDSIPTDQYIAVGQKGTVGQEPFVPAVTPAPLDLRIVGAMHPKSLSPCVPLKTPPTFADVPTFTTATWTPPPPSDSARWPGYPSYMLGLGVADAFFNRTLYELWSGGAFCLNVGSATSAIISTGLFRTFLPSLGTLAEDKDAPMILAIRPQEIPNIRIGEGTYHLDGAALVLDDPLLAINMPKMQIGFYALLFDRYVQLFSLTTDIALKIGLEVRTDNTLRPILGEIQKLATNIEVQPSELLAEDPKILEDLVPTLIAFAEPMLAGAIAPIALPVVQNFKLHIRDLRGVVAKSGGDGFETLGVFADLEYVCPQGQTCAQYAVDTRAEIVQSIVPTKGEIRASLGHGNVAKPRAIIDARKISTREGDGDGQFSWRVNGGMWSPWIDADRFEVTHPIFLMQGRHKIEIESRPENDPRAIDPTPAVVEFLVDWEAPEGAVVEDPETGDLRAEVRDFISPPEKLAFRWRLGENGAWSGVQSEPPRVSADVAQGESLQVKVTDEAGNEAFLASAGWGDMRGFHGKRSTGGGTGGCGCGSTSSSAGAAWLFAVGVALVAMRRRRNPRLR